METGPVRQVRFTDTRNKYINCKPLANKNGQPPAYAQTKKPKLQQVMLKQQNSALIL
jgi:hypothetical protein